MTAFATQAPDARAERHPGRHIDQTARMLWLTLRNSAGQWTPAELVYHWRPTFTAHQVRDALERLGAVGCARRIDNPGRASSYTAHGCDPLPGYAP